MFGAYDLERDTLEAVAGTARLGECVAANCCDVQRMREAILAALDAHCGLDRLADDATFLLLKALPASG